MKRKITKIVAAISVVFVICGIILCTAGAVGNGSLSRALKNMGVNIYYNDNHENNRNGYEYYNDDIDDFDAFFDEFFDVYEGGNGDEASL